MATEQQLTVGGHGAFRDALSAGRLTRIAALVTTLLAIAATVGIVAAIIALNGADPGAAFKALVQGSLGGQFAIGQTIMIASLLALTGLAVAIPFSARLWNVGGEGQLYFGAFASVGVALTIGPNLPHWFFAPLIVVVGMLAGAAWALVPGILKATIDANEVIVTLMLSFVAINLSTFAIRGLWPQGVAPQTRPVPRASQLPDIWHAALVNVGAVLAVAAAAAAWVVMTRTRLGFKIRATGFNANASLMSGISPRAVTMSAFALGGAFAGLAGTIIVVGINNAMITGFSANYGFLGIAVALLARLNPALILPSAFFFAILRVGSNSFRAQAGLDPAVGDVIVAVFVLLLLFFRVIRLNSETR